MNPSPFLCQLCQGNRPGVKLLGQSVWAIWLRNWMGFPLDLAELLLNGQLQDGAWMERKDAHHCQCFEDTVFKEAKLLAATCTPLAGLGRVGFTHTFTVFASIKWELEHEGVGTWKRESSCAHNCVYPSVTKSAPFATSWKCPVHEARGERKETMFP